MSSMMSVIAEFCKGLPSYNESNFTKFHVDVNSKPPSKKPTVYVPTKDYPSEHIIVTEKTSILLKYMQQRWDKKSPKKRDLPSEQEEPARKRPRLDLYNPN